jgi:hypothetical protein
VRNEHAVQPSGQVHQRDHRCKFTHVIAPLFQRTNLSLTLCKMPGWVCRIPHSSFACIHLCTLLGKPSLSSWRNDGNPTVRPPQFAPQLMVELQGAYPLFNNPLFLHALTQEQAAILMGVPESSKDSQRQFSGPKWAKRRKRRKSDERDSLIHSEDAILASSASTKSILAAENSHRRFGIRRAHPPTTLLENCMSRMSLLCQNHGTHQKSHFRTLPNVVLPCPTPIGASTRRK